MHDPAQLSENRDLLAYLRKSGFADLLDAAPTCMVGGKLSAAAVARRLGIRRSRASQMILFARQTINLQMQGMSTADPSTLFSTMPPATARRSAQPFN